MNKIYDFEDVCLNENYEQNNFEYKLNETIDKTSVKNNIFNLEKSKFGVNSHKQEKVTICNCLRSGCQNMYCVRFKRVFAVANIVDVLIALILKVKRAKKMYWIC